MYQSILVPVDGSDYARKALDIACELADPARATIYLLNVTHLPTAQDPLGIAVGAPAFGASEEEAMQAGLDLIEQIKKAEQEGQNLIGRTKSATGAANIELKGEVRMGLPAEVIASEAARLEVDAIVMGSRGLSDLKGLVIGSVSHKVMHIARCTVITVH